jgi:hypothetical protein
MSPGLGGPSTPAAAACRSGVRPRAAGVGRARAEWARRPPSRGREPRTLRAMPGLYLAAIVGSFAGLALLERRFRLGLASRATLVAIVVVEVAFLAFDLLGASRGWFATNTDWVIAYWPPGIPPEELLLLAFIAAWSIALYRLAERWTGEEGPAANELGRAAATLAAGTDPPPGDTGEGAA